MVQSAVAMATRMADALDPDPDRALAARAAAGDRAAFETIYHRYCGPVFARLTRLLGPTAEREDVLQQAFLQVHRGLGSFRGESSLSTFVHRVALHAAYDHLRRTPRVPVPAELDDVIADAPSPASLAADRQLVAHALALLSHLTPDKRIAFVLVAVEGLPLREAAELVDASADAVKQRALHARRELLALLARAERTPRSSR